jgi:hypothetical protein
LQATIQLSYPDAKTASAVAAAVSPDNQQVPAGLKVITVQSANSVVTDIHLDGKLVTLIATIDDLLAAASVAEKSLKTLMP